MTILFNTCPICKLINNQVYFLNFSSDCPICLNDLEEIIIFEECLHFVCITCINEFVNDYIYTDCTISRIKNSIPCNFFIIDKLIFSNTFNYCDVKVRWIEYDKKIILFDVDDTEIKNSTNICIISKKNITPWVPENYMAINTYYDGNSIWVLKEYSRWY